MNAHTPAVFDLPKLDRWLQRLAAASMLALALSLVGMGVAFYAHPAHSPLSQLSQKETPP